MLFVATTMMFGTMFSYSGFHFQEKVSAYSGTIENVNLELEYERSSETKEDVIEDGLTYGHKVVKIQQVTSRIDNFGNVLRRRYRVETVRLNSELVDEVIPVSESIYYIEVKMRDTQAPLIDGNDIHMEQGKPFEVKDLHIHAYDVVDGDLNYSVISNKVDTATPGTYPVVIEAIDHNGLATTRTFQITVDEPVVNEVVEEPYVNTSYTSTNYEYVAPAPIAPLDRNNLSVRGWKIIANDGRVSDDTIRSYMSELEGLPWQYTTAHFHTVYIDMTLSYPYLGMAYSDGRIYLNGSGYYATILLHEATHTYDFANHFSGDARLIAARNAELGKLPAKFSGNINDDAYEWVANLVVYYYYDPYTLQVNAPMSYDFVRNVILR